MEQAVKQRLVGAAVLTALAVITLPLVFDTRRPDPIRVTETIPERPVIAPVEVPAPQPVPLLDSNGADGKQPVPVADMYQLDSDKAVEADKSPEPEPPAAAQPAAVAPPPVAAIAPSTAAPSTATPPPKPLPAVPAAPGGKLNAANMPEGWLVQVGAVNDKKKAEAMVAELKLNGHAAFSTTAHSDKGDTIRVFVGPKLDKAKANQLRQRIDKDMGVKSMVVPFVPK